MKGNGFEEKTWINLILAENLEKKRKNTFFLLLFHLHTHAHTHTHTQTHTHTPKHTNTHHHTQTHKHTQWHAQPHTHKHTHPYPLDLSLFPKVPHILIPTLSFLHTTHSFILEHLNRHIAKFFSFSHSLLAKRNLFHSTSPFILTHSLSFPPSIFYTYIHPRTSTHAHILMVKKGERKVIITWLVNFISFSQPSFCC